MQDILNNELDAFLAEFMFHAGVPSHIAEDVMLHRYIGKQINCVKAGLAHSQLYPPNRHKLADGLLDKVYSKISEEIAPVFAAVHHTGMATDGYFSLFGFIHSKSRNRLYGHKVERLVYIYQNMRLLRRIRDPAFTEPCVLPHYPFDDEEEEEEE